MCVYRLAPGRDMPDKCISMSYDKIYARMYYKNCILYAQVERKVIGIGQYSPAVSRFKLQWVLSLHSQKSRRAADIDFKENTHANMCG